MSDFVRIIIALLSWLAFFSVIYGLHGLGCAAGWTDMTIASAPLFRTALVFAWIVALAAQLGLLFALRARRFASPSPFVGNVSVTLAIAALVATIWSLFPVAMLSACL